MDFDLISLIIGVLAGIFIATVFFLAGKKRDTRGLTIEEIIVHEIKTSLTGLSWIFSNLSEVKPGDSVSGDILELIREGKNKIDTAMEMANDALIAINTSSSQTPYKFTRGNLVNVVGLIVEENKLGAKEKSINMQFLFDKDLPLMTFDEARIILVARNLIANAIKYSMIKGNVTIDIHKDENKAVMSVSDTGIGIPAAELAKVSNKFFRATNTGEITGSGLGLFIVRNIVTGHGGTMDIQSREGSGTKVTIFLPIK